MNSLCCNCLIGLFALWLSPLCLAQVVTVRIINITNGHPLQKQRVSLSLLYDKGEQRPAKYDEIISHETNINGEADFELPEPPPRILFINIRMSSEHWRCTRTWAPNTQEVVQRGIVRLPGGKPQKTDVLINAVPGVMVFPARPFTFWERLLYPLLKG